MPLSKEDSVARYLLQPEILVLNPVELDCFIAADGLPHVTSSSPGKLMYLTGPDYMFGSYLSILKVGYLIDCSIEIF